MKKYGEYEKIEIRTAAKNIRDYAENIMTIIDTKDVNNIDGRFDLLNEWDKIVDELNTILLMGHAPDNTIWF
jgi:hypothetical protein